MITAKIIADSINIHTADRLTTFEIEYPRFIHAEVMTHKMLAKNSQSSRAVPVKNVLQVNNDFVRPIVWGKNKSGMSSAEELNVTEQAFAENLWNKAANTAFEMSAALAEVGLHKQWANRPTEPFSKIKVVISGTEYDNFFWLRDDPEAAQPEIVDLARKMKALYNANKPDMLFNGDWHLPYVTIDYIYKGDLPTRVYLDSNGNELSIEEALMISASCCGQVSYRKLDDSKEKALDIYNKLFSGPKPHYSPTEHQGMAFRPDGNWKYWHHEWPVGVSHMDRNQQFWSGNLKGFIQYRKILEEQKQ